VLRSSDSKADELGRFIGLGYKIFHGTYLAHEEAGFIELIQLSSALAVVHNLKVIG
jgi:hypothetical protein